jgi:hypothetical protein
MDAVRSAIRDPGNSGLAVYRLVPPGSRHLLVASSAVKACGAVALVFGLLLGIALPVALKATALHWSGTPEMGSHERAERLAKMLEDPKYTIEKRMDPIRAKEFLDRLKGKGDAK